MIKIVSDKESLLVFGHSNYDSKGRDVVCASVSTIVTGAAEIWKNKSGVEIKKWEEKGVPHIFFQFKFHIADNDLKYEYVFVLKYLRLIAEGNSTFVSFN